VVMVLAQTPAAGEPLPLGSRVPMLRVTIPPDQETLGLSNANFLVDTLQQDTEESAQAYYDAIDRPPLARRATLADWKLANGFGSPGAAADEASAIYVSHADLGFGRHMH